MVSLWTSHSCISQAPLQSGWTIASGKTPPWGLNVAAPTNMTRHRPRSGPTEEHTWVQTRLWPLLIWWCFTDKGMSTIYMDPWNIILHPKMLPWQCHYSVKIRVRDSIVLASWIYLLDPSPSGRRRLLQEVKQLIWTQLEHTVAITTAKFPMEQDRIRWIYNLRRWLGIVPFKPSRPKRLTCSHMGWYIYI